MKFKMIFLSLIFFSHLIKAQSDRNCEILNVLIKSDTFSKRFQLIEDNKDPIVIVDTARNFSACEISTIYGRDVIITFDPFF